VGCIDIKFKQQFENYFTEMDEMSDGYIRCAIDLPLSEEKEAMIQELGLDLKYKLRDKLDEFVEVAKELMLKYEYYGVYYALQKIILDAD